MTSCFSGPPVKPACISSLTNSSTPWWWWSSRDFLFFDQWRRFGFCWFRGVWFVAVARSLRFLAVRAPATTSPLPAHRCCLVLIHVSWLLASRSVGYDAARLRPSSHPERSEGGGSANGSTNFTASLLSACTLLRTERIYNIILTIISKASSFEFRAVSNTSEAKGTLAGIALSANGACILLKYKLGVSSHLYSLKHGNSS